MKTTFVVTIAVLLALIVPEADCIGAQIANNPKKSKVRVNFNIETSKQKTRLPLL